MMRLNKLLAAAAFAMIAGSSYAQTVVIEPAQETAIREYVASHKVAPVELSEVEVTVGAVLPEAVELHAIEAPDITYSYVLVGDQTLVVEPETREIIHIIR